MDKKAYQIIKTSLLTENVGQVEGLPRNPRWIKDERYAALKKSIQDAPEFLEARMLLVYPHDGKYVVIAGNMRLKACKELGFKELPCYVFKENTPVAKLREYAIKDNIAFGDIDWDCIANEWDSEELADWGMECDFLNTQEVGDDDENTDDNTPDDEKYSKKIEIPIYPCDNPKPELSECFDSQKCQELIDEIEKSDEATEEEKTFLKMAAFRHCVINFEKVADYYAHSSKALQELFENNALVLVDFNKAVEHGYIVLTDELRKSYLDDYGNEE